MRFLSLAMVALFIGGCARYNVRTTFDRERGTVTEVESRGVSMDPEANIYAVGAFGQGSVYADTYSRTGGYWYGIPRTEAEFHGIRSSAVPRTDVEQRLEYLERDVGETRDGVDGVAESQRRLVEQMRGGAR